VNQDLEVVGETSVEGEQLLGHARSNPECFGSLEDEWESRVKSLTVFWQSIQTSWTWDMPIWAWCECVLGGRTVRTLGTEACKPVLNLVDGGKEDLDMEDKRP
jgi:hypothetical protein